MPLVKQCGNESTDLVDGCYNTVQQYSNIIFDLIEWVINGNVNTGRGIKKLICKKYLPFIEDQIGTFLKRMSPLNSAVIMIYAGLSYDKLNKLNNVFKWLYNFKPFSSSGSISAIFDRYRPVYDRFVTISIPPTETSFNRLQNIRNGCIKVTVYVFSLLLAISMNIDGWVNSNNYQNNPLLTTYSNQIPVLCGSDRCDIDGMGCYSFSSVALCGGSANSATHATTNMVVYGAFKDDFRSISAVYQGSGVGNELSALNRLPIAVTFIKYNEQIDDNGANVLVHRQVSTCVVAFNVNSHVILNAQKNKDPTKVQNEWIQNNPIKNIVHNDNSINESTDFIKWQSRSQDRMGISNLTKTRNRENDNVSKYNWKISFMEYHEHIKNFTAKPYMLCVQGFFRDKRNHNISIIKSIDDHLDRSLGSTESNLPFVSDFDFNESMSGYIYLKHVNIVV